MRKIISMLLAVSMSLSVMCSSFTVTAVDGNNTAAQTESTAQSSGTGFEGLFANEINEKVAEKSNDCGINSVEVNGNTATVSYWSSKDCTVLVGIYEDDGTKGTHMVTFGTANVKAAENEAAVTIDNLPPYFYLKAFLVDSDTHRPLAIAYENSNYTKDMKEFFDYSIYDFDPENVWNFDENPDNNFMVLTDEVVTVNMELSISSSDIEITENSITVKNLANDPNSAKLKKGSPFMFWSDTETMTYGTVTNITVNGDETVIEYGEAQISDLFEYIRIETENVKSDEQSAFAEEQQLFANNTENGRVLTTCTDDEQVFTDQVEEQNVFNFNTDNERTLSASAKSPDYSDYQDATIELVETKFSHIKKKLEVSSGDDKPWEAGVDAEISLQFAVNADAILYYKTDVIDLIFELVITPSVTVNATASGHIKYKEEKPLEITIANFLVCGLPVGNIKAKLTYEFEATVEASGEITVSTKYIAAVDANKAQHDKVISFTTEPQEPDISGNFSATFEVPVTLSVEGNLVDTPFGALATLGAEAKLTPGATALLGDDNIFDNKKHNCDFCTTVTLKLELSADIYLESPVVKALNLDAEIDTALDGTWSVDGNKLTYAPAFVVIEGIPIPLPIDFCQIESFKDYSTFHVSKPRGSDNWEVGYGECDNYLYRTYVYVKDELSDSPIKDIYVFTSNLDVSESSFAEGRTGVGGLVKLYLKPNTEYKLKAAQNTGFDDSEISASISEPDESITIKISPNSAPTSIEPRPVEGEEVPKFIQGDALRYTTLWVVYGTGDSEWSFSTPFTEDMIKEFDPEKIGTQTLVIEYNGTVWEKEIEIIEDTRMVDRISINTLPDKTDYITGEELDVTGMTIDLHFTDGTSKNNVTVTPDMVSGFDSNIPGTQSITVTYTDNNGNTKETTFNVTVKGPDGITGISIHYIDTPNKYCLQNGELNIKNMVLKISHVDGNDEYISVTEDMINDIDTSTLGTKTVTITYKDSQVTYEVQVVENLNIVYKIGFCSGFDRVEYAYDLYNIEHPLEAKTPNLICYYIDGSAKIVNVRAGIKNNMSPDFTKDGYAFFKEYYDKLDSNYIKVSIFDGTEVGIHKITATYCLKDGTPILNADGDLIIDYNWYSVVPYVWYSTTSTNTVGAKKDFDVRFRKNNANIYNIGDTLNADDFYFIYEEKIITDPENDKVGSINRGPTISRDPVTGYLQVLEPEYLLSNARYLGGFDTSTVGSRSAYFEYDGYVIKLDYTVQINYGTSTASYSSFEDYAAYDYGTDDWTYEPEFTDETETPDIMETETPDETETSDSTESTEPIVTEPVDTDTEVTEPTVTEPIVTEPTVNEPDVTETQVETSTVEEAPVLAIDNNGVFGFGRAGRKTAQYANLHKNDIYNYYVVKSAAADILGKDNLLFVGQTSSDGNGSLSFEYETTTGEDGEIILRPMSDDPTTPDKPSTPNNPNNPTTPNAPGNGGSSSNTAVIPVNGTITKTMTVKVENKVTGKKSKVAAKKTGSSVTVKLGTENDGCYANVYTTDDEYICSAIIENGRAKFNVSNDVKLKIVIDSIAYGEDVSSGAGAFGASAAENLPYAVITIVIAIVGIYFKRRSEKKVK